jgi:hypothetical protein
MTPGKIFAFLLCICDIIFIVLFALVLVVSPLKLATGNSNAKVHIRKEGNTFQLYKNGEPFIIRGACGDGEIRELADLGANTLRVYDTVNLTQILDEAESVGISVIVDIPILPCIQQFGMAFQSFDYYSDPAENNRTKRKVTQLVRRHKNHPALLYWNLGNEVYYPPLLLRPNNFIRTFNELIEIIHEEDPDHLVSTTLTFPSKVSLFSIMLHSNKLDLVGFNAFGGIEYFERQISNMGLFFRAFPFYLSEWGHYGPWEAGFTRWKAPTEPLNKEKIEQIWRHNSVIKPFEKGASLGALYFFWGEKLEGTHTWFSTHLGDTLTSELTHTLKQVWTNVKTPATSIGLEKVLFDEQHAQENLFFAPGEEKTARVTLQNQHKDSLVIRWELMPDPWDMSTWGIRPRPPIITGKLASMTADSTILTVPEDEGPYRLFVYVVDQEGNYATSNIPFYVLNNFNGQ